MSPEYLTIEQIQQRYPDQWVLIDRPRIGRHQHVQGGYVLMSTPDRDEFDRRLGDFPDVTHIAVRYTGEPAPDEELVLHLDL